MSKSRAKNQDVRDAHRGERWGRYGREMEQRVRLVLERSGRFTTVSYSAPYSPEDCQGVDFEVARSIDGNLVTRRFGITISHRSCEQSRRKHPDIKQMHLPINVKDETILAKVERLFAP